MPHIGVRHEDIDSPPAKTRYLKPLLFDRLDGEGVVTLNLDLVPYRQALKVMDAGYRFAIRARPRKRYELTVRDDGDQAVSLVNSSQLGVDLHRVAEQLIGHAHCVLFDPLPW